MQERQIDVTNSEEIRKFVAASDAAGPPGSEAASAYWKTIRFVAPDWLTARANQLHAFSKEYFELQDQLYLFLRGFPYAGGPSELTEIDKEAAVASRLAYPDRTPGDLNKYMLAHAKFAALADLNMPCEVLEVGSGWGFSAEYMARLGHRVTAVDVNPDFIDVASRRSAKGSLGIDYRLGAFDDLPVKSGENFEVIYCFEAFHHARDFRGALSRFTELLSNKGRIILFGEPFIDSSMWPSWGLRLDPLSIYCVAKFGWWQSGWTREFMHYVFRSVGLCSTFVDDNSDFERYMIGRFGNYYSVDQLSYQPMIDGWRRDRHYLIAGGNSRLEFYRPMESVVLAIESFAPIALSVRFESQALTAPVTTDVPPGPSQITLKLSATPPTGLWDIRMISQTWNPRRLLGNGEDRDLAFHLLGVEEHPVGKS